MSDVDTSADKPYESIEEFHEEKDDLMARYWLDPYETDEEESRSDVAAAVAISIFSIVVVGAVFLAILWLANHPPNK